MNNFDLIKNDFKNIIKNFRHFYQPILLLPSVLCVPLLGSVDHTPFFAQEPRWHGWIFAGAVVALTRTRGNVLQAPYFQNKILNGLAILALFFLLQICAYLCLPTPIMAFWAACFALVLVVVNTIRHPRWSSLKSETGQTPRQTLPLLFHQYDSLLKTDPHMQIALSIGFLCFWKSAALLQLLFPQGSLFFAASAATAFWYFNFLMITQGRCDSVKKSRKA